MLGDGPIEQMGQIKIVPQSPNPSHNLDLFATFFGIIILYA